MAITGFLPKRNPDDKIITIVGNAGSDPELKYAQNGNAYARVNVAASKGRDNNRETQWYQVTAFGQQAENLAQTISKGDRLMVRGVYKETVLPANDKYPNERTVYEILAGEVAASMLWKPVSPIKVDRTTQAINRGAAKRSPVTDDGFEEDEPF